jgi:EamA-like transporter family
VLISALKGGTAGLVNLGIALVWGAHLPALRVTLAALVVGFLGYGVSLTLFVRALRELGAARTGAYFSVAPFVGAGVAVTVLAEPLTGGLIIGALLMALGVWLHVTEGHAHEHVHEPLAHEHRHRHDAHHLHAHDPGMPAGEPHSHWHEHGPLRHRHPHYPDLHHRHPH